MSMICVSESTKFSLSGSVDGRDRLEGGSTVEKDAGEVRFDAEE